MATTQELFDYARLANAAYVNLSARNWVDGSAMSDEAAFQGRLPRTLGDATFV